MWISDDALTDLGGLDAAETRSWLREHQRADHRIYWWEDVANRALRVMNRATTPAERHAFARVACSAIGEALDQEVMDPRDGAIRVAHIAASYVSAGGADDLPISIDSIVARCLDLIDVSREAAIEQAVIWETLRIDQIGALRNAKNLVAPCAPLASRISDGALSQRLSGWLGLWNQLP